MRVVKETLARFGRIDIPVNNAARRVAATSCDIRRRRAERDRSDIVSWGEDVPPVVPEMRKTGAGVIVMIASIWGRESGGRMTYNAVKAAEISLAKAMAQQLAKDNIRVNSIAPGSISFEGGTWWKRQQEDPQGIADFIKRDLPFGRFGTADEVGAVVAFVASPRASWVSGASITVDGCQSRSNI
jgi:3-oxoacyl-[acyl-carrier protein] reductase